MQLRIFVKELSPHKYPLNNTTKMNFEEIVKHRRAVRYYDPEKPLDTARVEHCLRLASLAPTSSNLQLWECYHITDPAVIASLAPACFSQTAVTTAQQLVVFVTKPHLWRKRTHQLLELYRVDTRKHHPEDKWEKYDKLRADYLLKVIPFTYSRGLGIWGLIRKGLVQIAGLFRPVPRQMSEGDLTAIQHKSCALVAQTFMLAMSSEGYDTCPLEGIDTLRVRRLLGLPRGTKINMIVSCGIRDESRPLGDRIRVPFESQYHRIGE